MKEDVREEKRREKVREEKKNEDIIGEKKRVKRRVARRENREGEWK